MSRPRIVVEIDVDHNGDWIRHTPSQDGVFRSTYSGRACFWMSDPAVAHPRPRVPLEMPVELTVPIPRSVYQRRPPPPPPTSSSSSGSRRSESVHAPPRDATPVYVPHVSMVAPQPRPPQPARGPRIRQTPRKSVLRRFTTFSWSSREARPAPASEAGPSQRREDQDGEGGGENGDGGDDDDDMDEDPSEYIPLSPD